MSPEITAPGPVSIPITAPAAPPILNPAHAPPQPPACFTTYRLSGTILLAR